MQTSFTPTQLMDPQIASSEKILRACVHCGFCTATCPTYVLLGDELDSPRGRIYLIKEMLEKDQPATREVVKHIDRCLSCLACMTTCPSGVNYMHLVDHARDYIEQTYKRPITDRLLRGLLARVLVDLGLFRLAVLLGLIARPLAPVFDVLGLRRLGALLRLTPRRKPPPPVDRVGKVYSPEDKCCGRVALLSGCINPVLAPSTIEATIRLLNRQGIEVVVAAGEGCCGSLLHTWGAKRKRCHRRAIILMHGPERSKGRASMPSWSPFPGVAQPSRTTGSCCATTRPMRPRRRAFRLSRATSASTWRP